MNIIRRFDRTEIISWITETMVYWYDNGDKFFVAVLEKLKLSVYSTRK